MSNDGGKALASRGAYFTPEGYVTCACMTLGSALVVGAWLMVNFAGPTDILAAAATNIAAERNHTFLDDYSNASAQARVQPTGAGLSTTGFPSLGRIADWLTCGQYGVRSVVLGATLPSAVYWTVAWVLMLFDMRFEALGRLRDKKTYHPGFTAKIDHRLYRKAVYLGLLVTGWSWLVHVAVFHQLQRILNGNGMCLESAPMFPTDGGQAVILLVKLFVMWLLTDVIFYSTHRLCHEVPFLYKHIHKVHHQWVVSYGVDAATCHPLEHLMVNMMTVELPAILVGLPLHIHTLWLVAASVNTVLNHSGYNLLGSVAHDRHHHYNNCEYGTDTFCDRFLKTTFKDRNPQLFDASGALISAKKDE